MEMGKKQNSSQGTYSRLIEGCHGECPYSKLHSVHDPCKLKLDEEKSKCVGLAQQNGFVPTFLYTLLSFVQFAGGSYKAQQSISPAQRIVQ